MDEERLTKNGRYNFQHNIISKFEQLWSSNNQFNF